MISPSLVSAMEAQDLKSNNTLNQEKIIVDGNDNNKLPGPIYDLNTSTYFSDDSENESSEVEPRFIWLAVPAIAISDIVWATIGATAVTGSLYLLWINQPTLTNEIDTAYKAIPKKLLDSDGSVDLGKFTQKQNNRVA